MRKYLLIAFLGLWVALFPLLPIQCGSTQKAAMLVVGLVIFAIAIWSLRDASRQ